jgi:asparagine synthase (glutamine-hydrolysing)
MCGVSGYYGAFARDLLEAMSASQRHRGPDDLGTWSSSDGRVGLAHNRLSIIDLTPTGHQPMFDEETGAGIVYNGEIYNFRELRRDLELRGHRFRGRSDTEVLLRAYLEHGEGCLERLNGIFAFAIYDPRESTLLLARDQFGVKPLYVAEVEEGLIFASELKALLQAPQVARDLDPVAIARYVTFLWNPGTSTPLRSVRRLAPGHLLRVNARGRVETRCYFRPTYAPAATPRSEADLVEEFDARLRTAVERQMVADVPVGAFLSGGLDSSAIVIHATRMAGPNGLDCFTIAPRGAGAALEGMQDDIKYARIVAKQTGVRLHEVDVGPEIIERLPQAIFHLDEPQADPAAINVLCIAELARRNGLKVLLSGAGGDDLLSGYRRHVAYEHEWVWRWLPRPVRLAVSRLAAAVPAGAGTFARRLTKALANAHLDGDARLMSYFFWLDPDVVRHLIGDAAPGGAAMVAPLHHELAQLSPPPSGLNRMLALEQRFFLADHNLNYTDKLSMAASVEVRVPFLDMDFADFANRLPLSMKQRGGTGKWILRRAMRQYLPDDVIDRPKRGFGAPLRYWLKHELAPWVDDAVSSRSLRERGLFDEARVRHLVAQDRAGRIDASYAIFAILCIELWCRTFVDPPVPTPVC